MSGASASPGRPESRSPQRGRGRTWLRLPLLLGGAVALVAGLAGGLERLGWEATAGSTDIAALHGPLMVCGFFGAVIALERAVALRRLWAYLAPLAAGLASLSAIAVPAAQWAQSGWIVSAAVLTGASSLVAWRQPALFTIVLSLGAASWLLGILAWTVGASVPSVALLWMAFLVLTIAAERLELSRLVRVTTMAKAVFSILAGLLLLSAGFAMIGGSGAWMPAGASLLGLAAWLMRYDVARRTVGRPGLPRYAAVCLLGGYGWLGLAGGLMLGFQLDADHLAYDAALHAVFLGFVFAMVFGHAPIILPAVARVPVPFRPSMYVPLALLHVSLAMRIVGDLGELYDIRRWSGVLSAAAIASFIAIVAASASVAYRRANCGSAKTAGGGHGSLRP